MFFWHGFSKIQFKLFRLEQIHIQPLHSPSSPPLPLHSTLPSGCTRGISTGSDCWTAPEAARSAAATSAPRPHKARHSCTHLWALKCSCSYSSIILVAYSIKRSRESRLLQCQHCSKSNAYSVSSHTQPLTTAKATRMTVLSDCLPPHTFPSARSP